LLIVFYGTEEATATLAKAVESGARNVRFMETRVVASERIDAEDGPQLLTEHDAVVFVASPGGLPQLEAFVARTRQGHSYAWLGNVVVGALGAGDLESGAVVVPVVELGGLLVSPAYRGTSDLGRAEAYGERVAKVAGWIRHALSHEHGREHGNGHAHS
jgi:hypothetical protein